MSQRKNGLDLIRPVIHMDSDFPPDVIGPYFNSV